MRTAKTKNLILCGLFTSLIVVGAFIRIPIPVVPFTLQLLFTMLAGLLLGGKWGAASVCIYIVLGLMGLPVFAEGGGLAYVLKPSFGYIIGFALHPMSRDASQTKPPIRDISGCLSLTLSGLESCTYSEWYIII